ncbi:protein kinase domain-containing protein [Haematococcus lacustris]|uniref:Protein kinase domain-containing protein n=1 Tax=Haematococcus lacustris TaxID=44745 RepID=A0A699ZQ40_HAELA|nr:protein kinase domain-containing protein [Haematococcus lacustris]
MVRSRVEEIEDEELLLWQMSRVLGPFPPETLAAWGGGAEQLLRGMWSQGQRDGAGAAGELVWLRPLPSRLAAEAPHLNQQEVEELAAFLTPLLDYDPFARPSADMVLRHPWLRC